MYLLMPAVELSTELYVVSRNKKHQRPLGICRFLLAPAKALYFLDGNGVFFFLILGLRLRLSSYMAYSTVSSRYLMLMRGFR